MFWVIRSWHGTLWSLLGQMTDVHYHTMTPLSELSAERRMDFAGRNLPRNERLCVSVKSGSSQKGPDISHLESFSKYQGQGKKICSLPIPCLPERIL